MTKYPYFRRTEKTMIEGVNLIFGSFYQYVLVTTYSDTTNSCLLLFGNK